MSFFDCWNNDKKSSHLFIGPEGFGKTKQLKYIECEILKLKNIIPLYIDINDAKLINRKNIFDYIISEYCGDISGIIDKALFLLENYLKDNSNYEFVVLIDHFENAVDNGIFDEISNQIIELSGYEKVSVVATSTYYDEKVFSGFKKHELSYLSVKQIKNYLEKELDTDINIGNFSESLIKVLSFPSQLVEFKKLVQNSDVELYNSKINTKYDLIEASFSKYKSRNALFILNEALPYFAYYCSSNNKLSVPKEEMEDMLYESSNKHRFIDVIKRVFAHNYEQSSRTIDNIVDDFGKFVESLDIGRIEIGNKKDCVGFRFNHKYYQDYFTALYFYNIDESSEFLNCLNDFLLNDLVSDFLYQIMLGKIDSKVFSRQLEIIGQLNGNLTSISPMQKTKYMNLTTNIIKLLKRYNGHLSELNLSNLDLRYCNFIGKNCQYTLFNNSLFVDECFVPIEPEKSNIFAISPSGNYYITGNSSCLNIRLSNVPIVAKRLFDENDNPFESAFAIDDKQFKIICRDMIVSFEIKDDYIDHVSVEDRNESNKDLNASSFNNLSEYSSYYGEVCCVNEKFMLVRSYENSFYGNAYLLFDLNTDELVSVHKICVPMKIDAIYQTGSEIEFLPVNNGKPLKTICYNENSKKVYKKQYPSMVGRGVGYNTRRIYFDTDDVENYIKYFFYKYLKLHDESWIEESDCENIVISKAHIERFGEDTCIHTKNCRISIENNNENFLFYCNHSAVSPYTYWYEFSTKDYYSFDDIKNIKFYCFKNDKYSFDLNRFDNGYGFSAFNTKSINLKNVESDYELMVCNDVYKLNFVKTDEKSDGVLVVKELIVHYNLNLVPKYEEAIEKFPWQECIKLILESWHRDKSILKKICSEIVEVQICNIKREFDDYYNSIWEFVFADYISDYIRYCELNSESQIPNDEEFINGIKNWCFPCDNGVVYYDGKHSCYLRYKASDLIETCFVHGAHLSGFRNGIHIDVLKENENAENYYALYDIYKDASENAEKDRKVPIYDLDLYGVYIDNIIGLSKSVNNIIKEQSKIPTREITFDD